MSNKKLSKQKRSEIHAPGAEQGIGLCGVRGKSSRELERINCETCYERAYEAIQALRKHLEHERADAALADRQPAPWWVTGQQEGETLAPTIGAP